MKIRSRFIAGMISLVLITFCILSPLWVANRYGDLAGSSLKTFEEVREEYYESWDNETEVTGYSPYLELNPDTAASHHFDEVTMVDGFYLMDSTWGYQPGNIDYNLTVYMDHITVGPESIVRWVYLLMVADAEEMLDNNVDQIYLNFEVLGDITNDYRLHLCQYTGVYNGWVNTMYVLENFVTSYSPDPINMTFDILPSDLTNMVLLQNSQNWDFCMMEIAFSFETDETEIMNIITDYQISPEFYEVVEEVPNQIITWDNQTVTWYGPVLTSISGILQRSAFLYGGLALLSLAWIASPWTLPGKNKRRRN